MRVVSTLVVMGALVWGWPHEVDAETEKAQNPVHLGYYENLGAMAFAAYTEFYRQAEDAESKTGFARQYWFAAFYYWYEVEKKLIPKSDKVLKAIQVLSRRNFDTNHFQFYRDPLLWSDHPKSQLSPGGFKGISKAQYLEAMLAFKEWIAQNPYSEHPPAP